MRSILSAIFFVLLVVRATADVFSSPEAFVDQLKNYDFAADPHKLGFYLSIQEPRQPEEREVRLRKGRSQGAPSRDGAQEVSQLQRSQP